ncbi:MAG: hypothetical protein ACLR7Z_17145 [Bilophila wadsworthia]
MRVDGPPRRATPASAMARCMARSCLPVVAGSCHVEGVVVEPRL